MTGWKNFYHQPTRISRMCMRIYIFCLKKPHTQTKKFPLANSFARFYVFSFQTIKDRVPCFSTKKRAVRVFFLSVNFLKNIQWNWYSFLGPPGWKCFSSPAFPETRVLFFLPNERIIDDLTRPIFAPKRLNTEISKHCIVFFF